MKFATNINEQLEGENQWRIFIIVILLLGSRIPGFECLKVHTFLLLTNNVKMIMQCFVSDSWSLFVTLIWHPWQQLHLAIVTNGDHWMHFRTYLSDLFGPLSLNCIKYDMNGPWSKISPLHMFWHTWHHFSFMACDNEVQKECFQLSTFTIVKVKLISNPDQIGDRVRVKSSVTTPKYKWGSVNHNSIGVVTSISANGRDVTVDFPMQGTSNVIAFDSIHVTFLFNT